MKIRNKVFTILNFLYDQLSWVPQKWGAFMLVPPSDPNGVLVGQQKWASHIVCVLCSSLCIMHKLLVRPWENHLPSVQCLLLCPRAGLSGEEDDLTKIFALKNRPDFRKVG